MPDEGSKRNERSWQSDMVEARRAQQEEFSWQVPTIAFVGQAFLFTIILNPHTAAEGRVAVSAVSLAVATAVLHMYRRARYFEAIHGEWINHRAGTGWDQIERDVESRLEGWPWRLRPSKKRKLREAGRMLWVIGGMLLILWATALFFLAASICELAGWWSPLK